MYEVTFITVRYDLLRTSKIELHHQTDEIDVYRDMLDVGCVPYLRQPQLRDRFGLEPLSLWSSEELAAFERVQGGAAGCLRVGGSCLLASLREAQRLYDPHSRYLRTAPAIFGRLDCRLHSRQTRSLEPGAKPSLAAILLHSLLKARRHKVSCGLRGNDRGGPQRFARRVALREPKQRLLGD